MSSFWFIALNGLAVVLAWKTLIWVLSLMTRNAGIVDIFWGPGFILFCCWTAFLAPPESPRQFLLPVLVALWGMRLAGHIFLRSRGLEEDHRYRAMRERAGPSFWWQSLFFVFWLQGVILWLVALPVVHAQISLLPADLTMLDALGCAVFAIGFLFEAVGDWQLARFKARASSRGQVLSSGLWRYTRHPNYFGEALVWWGLFLIGAATPHGWMFLLSPLLMNVLLLKVSGVTLLEVKLKETRPAYRHYVEHTSSFIPWPPKRPV
jgi:steroid 5-alpha reductase family enzyme